MRVNFLIDFANSGDNGIANCASRLSERLEKEGVDVSINGSGYDYDIFHTHTPLMFNLFRMKRAKRLGVKVISHAHTTCEDVRGSFSLSNNELLQSYLNKYLRYFYNSADLVLTPSKWTRYTLIRKNVKTPIKVLSNGVDLKRFAADKDKAKGFREKYCLDKDDVLVYSVGLVFLRKGIETFKKVAEELTDLRFFWIGKKYNSLLVNYVTMNKVFKNMPSNLRFLGFIDSKDVMGAHCAGDIFMFPSFVENQGIAILEAAACSRPIVVRYLPVYDWALNRKNCFKCKKDEEFVKSIDTLSKDRKLRQRMGREARKVAEKNDIDKTVKELIKVYENIL